jgi:pyridoxal phosphate enzyme (YggS family)
MSDIASRLTSVRQRISELEQRYARAPGSVQLLAVSKTKPAAQVAQAHRAGQRAFGENHLQDALDKLDDAQLAGLDLEWHFIGPLQSNKTRTVAERFDWLHSLDRLKTARRLDEQRPAHLAPLQVCLQVNLSGEASKSGVPASEVAALATALAQYPRLRLRGLMTLPAPCTDPERQREPFRALRELLARLRAGGHDVDTLSMGMSDDMEAAIAEGATWVRIGTAIFGSRG